MRTVMSKRTNLAAALHNAGAKPASHPSTISMGSSPSETTRIGSSTAVVRPPSRSGQRVVTFYIKPEAHKQLRLLGVEQGKAVQELMVEALNDIFSKYGRSQIA